MLVTKGSKIRKERKEGGKEGKDERREEWKGNLEIWGEAEHQNKI